MFWVRETGHPALLQPLLCVNSSTVGLTAQAETLDSFLIPPFLSPAKKVILQQGQLAWSILSPRLTPYLPFSPPPLSPGHHLPHHKQPSNRPPSPGPLDLFPPSSQCDCAKAAHLLLTTCQSMASLCSEMDPTSLCDPETPA